MPKAYCSEPSFLSFYQHVYAFYYWAFIDPFSPCSLLSSPISWFQKSSPHLFPSPSKDGLLLCKVQMRLKFQRCLSYRIRESPLLTSLAVTHRIRVLWRMLSDSLTISAFRVSQTIWHWISAVQVLGCVTKTKVQKTIKHFTLWTVYVHHFLLVWHLLV